MEKNSSEFQKIDKVDPRILRSKRDLANALEELLTTKNYDSITIKEICENAMVSKLTFYNNFASKDELLSLIFAKYIKKILANINELLENNQDKIGTKHLYKDVIKVIVHFFYDKKDKITKIILNNQTSTIYWNINNLILKISPYLSKIYRNLVNIEVPDDVITSYYVGAFSNLLFNSTKNRNKYSADEMTNYIYNLTLGIGITMN